ncbi:unnamed protein product [Leptosia nina]|uniref:Uncharacterized protein n=1 Tax=Leptosia nina TaxID=320188 RepID=A0AAV1J9X2_9NEOP
MIDVSSDPLLNVCVKRRQKHAGSNNGSEVQEQEVVIVHDFNEVAPRRRSDSSMPAEEWEEAHPSTGNPAYRYYDWK